MRTRRFALPLFSGAGVLAVAALLLGPHVMFAQDQQPPHDCECQWVVELTAELKVARFLPRGITQEAFDRLSEQAKAKVLENAPEGLSAEGKATVTFNTETNELTVTMFIRATYGPNVPETRNVPIDSQGFNWAGSECVDDQKKELTYKLGDTWGSINSKLANERSGLQTNVQRVGSVFVTKIQAKGKGSGPRHRRAECPGEKTRTFNVTRTAGGFTSEPVD